MTPPVAASQEQPATTLAEVWAAAQRLGTPTPNEAILVIKVSRVEDDVTWTGRGDIGLCLFGALAGAEELAEKAGGPETGSRLHAMARGAMKEYLAHLAKVGRP